MNKNPTITSIFDYIVEVSGEFPYKQRQFYHLLDNNNVKLMLINATANKAFLLANTKEDELKIGAEIVLENDDARVDTTSDLFGNVIDIFGNKVLPYPEINNSYIQPTGSKVFELAHDLMSVKTLDQQLFTGIVSVDLLIPIGKGQRELIIGDRQTGKTHIAINTIINQAKEGIKSIYVAIGQKREAISRIYRTLTEFGAMQNTIIIDAPSTSAFEQYLAPYVGMAHAENLSYDNDVLIVFDDLTKHANIIREIALLTDRPVGKEAMPGDTFFSHSQLLERAGSFENRKTITALPILQTIDGDITSLVSSNIISITDGQIVTSSDLFSQGILPAINIDLSVSRTGSSVQSRSVTKVAAEVGKAYRKYKRHLKLSMLDYDFNKETTELLNKGKLIEKLFNQKGFAIYSKKTVLLTSKLISWGLFNGIKDQERALRFIDLLIQTNDQAQNAYNKIINDTEIYDDGLVRTFFASALKQYAKFNNYNWEISIDHDFVDFEESYLEELAYKLGDK